MKETDKHFKWRKHWIWTPKQLLHILESRAFSLFLQLIFHREDDTAWSNVIQKSGALRVQTFNVVSKYPKVLSAYACVALTRRKTHRGGEKRSQQITIQQLRPNGRSTPWCLCIHPNYTLSSSSPKGSDIMAAITHVVFVRIVWRYARRAWGMQTCLYMPVCAAGVCGCE